MTIPLLALLALTAAAAPTANPFLGQTFYVNPAFQAEVDSSIATCTDPTACANLRLMRSVASAFWVDTKAKIANTSVSVAGILADAASKAPPQAVVLVVYDLPNRDCHAKASNGEVCCTYNSDGTCNYDAAGDCAAGIQEYQDTYIAPLAALLGQYEGKVPIIAIIEPDSLPNLASNMGDNHCGNSATVAAYKTGLPFAISTIAAKAPSVAMYLDAAHGGWLGWENNAQAYAALVSGLGVAGALRGFATNVANYQPLGTACPTYDWCLPNSHPSDACCEDPCHLESQYNPGVQEHQYVQVLAHYVAGFMPSARFVIDTGRNGVDGMRRDCSNWCNIRGAGLGRLPTAATDDPSLIDAYFWLKTPGESDGCTQTLPSGAQCTRFDSFCGSQDSLGNENGEPPVPVAGQWYEYGVQALARLANFNATR